MGTLENDETRVVVSGTAPEERDALCARLAAAGLEVDVASDLDHAAELAREQPHVLVVGNADELEARLALVRSVRRNVRTACVRIIWLTDPSATDEAEAALHAGVDDLCPWPVPAEALVARVREQGAQSNLRRIAERQAALRAELARVEEALSRAEAEEARVQKRLAAPASPAPTTRSNPLTPRLRSGAQPVPAISRTQEFGVIEQRVLTLLREHLAGHREGDIVSVLVVGIDGWGDLLARRGQDLCERLLAAIADLIRSLLEPGHAVETMAKGRLCVLLPSSDESTAVRLARDICAQVASAPVKVTPRPYQTTVSIGVATLEPGRPGSPFDTVEWAREALELAWEKGGNRWWVYHAGK